MKNQNNMKKQYTFRPLKDLNVIDNFLFTMMLTRDEVKEQAALLILNSILDKQLRHVTVHAQKEYPGIDTDRHGIRLDVWITDDDDSATIYDLEPDKKADEAEFLPKRNRFYSAVMDSYDLHSGQYYNKLHNLVIIMILSYDPFGAGDLYYEAGTMLKTHPGLDYDDGIRRIYIYTDGTNNLKGSTGERLQTMVQYIRYSDKEHIVNETTAEMDRLVQRVKENEEVSMVYLRALEREHELKQEVRDYYEPILEQKELQITHLTERVEDQKAKLADKDAKLADKDAALADKDAKLADKDAKLVDKDAALADKDAMLERYINAYGPLPPE